MIPFQDHSEAYLRDKSKMKQFKNRKPYILSAIYTELSYKHEQRTIKLCQFRGSSSMALSQ